MDKPENCLLEIYTIMAMKMKQRITMICGIQDPAHYSWGITSHDGHSMCRSYFSSIHGSCLTGELMTVEPIRMAQKNIPQ